MFDLFCVRCLGVEFVFHGVFHTKEISQMTINNREEILGEEIKKNRRPKNLKVYPTTALDPTKKMMAILKP
uniref:Uncharacterized protein n=1 Tax=Solanum lycopersicum TaxID=4081 RepID=A0A3Q7H651_SOLLC